MTHGKDCSKSDHKEKKRYYLEDLTPKGCCNRKILDNRTVYVDIKYGARRGVINNPKCPFDSINRAINAIKDIPKTYETQWVIKVSPGNYDENVIVPLFVNIEGSGVNLTIVKSLYIEGTSNISFLLVSSNDLPLIKTKLDNQQENENSVFFNNVRVSAENILNTKNNSVILTTGNGLNNVVRLLNCGITAKVNSSNPATSYQSLFGVEARLVLINVFANFIVDFKAPASKFLVKSSVVVNGGNLSLFVNEGPAQEINLFKLQDPGAGVNVDNNTATIVVMIITQPYKADVSYIKVADGTSAVVTNSTANLDGVSVDFLNLVENNSLSVAVNLLSLATPNISVPRLKGNRNNIKYASISGNGDVVINGGLFGNIINVDAAGNPDGYFIQENDYTVLSNGANVNLFDPALANLQVTDKGKIINIRNIGTSPIVIASQNDSIFDGNQTLQASESISFQNNGILWYRIGR